jgi:F-type H+-transporting ATPase subunit epsilon
MATESQKLYLTITRVDGLVFDGEVQSVTVPGSEGEMTLLARHEPLISPLKAGTITVRQEGKDDQTFEVQDGILEIRDSKATVIV